MTKNRLKIQLSPYPLIVLVVLLFMLLGIKMLYKQRNIVLEPQVQTVVNPLKKKLPEQTIIFHGDVNQKILALTFDADMTPGMAKQITKGDETVWYNRKVIDTLRSTNTPATLFLSGMWIETHPQTSKDLAGDPLFELGNHSYSHPGFTTKCFGLKPVANKNKSEEIIKTQELLFGLTGKTNIFFRFPGGCYSDTDLALARSLNVLPIQWDNIGHDGFNPNTDEIFARLKSQTKNGSIIVLHMHGGRNAPKTAEAIEKYIPWAKSQGYEFVKLSTMLIPSQ